MATLGDRQGTVAYVAPKDGQGNQNVRIAYAPGMQLGPDGFFHPLESDLYGGLKVSFSDEAMDVLHEILMELRRIRLSNQLLTDDELSYTDAQDD